ncbi:MAG: adenylate/guanylate cyclase domain-containing protein [Candidatus Competibacteraceae bacterium]|nr:adenylate/guanylate cyclase domain-containing protein [Candidatus Competibacteraceae bacterium]
MSRLRERIGMRLGSLAPVALLMASAFAYLWEPLPLQILRNAMFDQYQRWRPRVYQPAPVRIIDIDDESLRRLGQWPWPRTQVAELISRLQNAQPAVIALDVVFAELDRTSPKAILDLWQVPPSLRQQLEALPDHDAVLAQTMRQGRVVLGFAVEQARHQANKPDIKARYVTVGEAPHAYLHAFSSAVNPLPILADAAAGLGAITFIPDADGVVRRAPLLIRIGDTLAPALAAEALRVAQGARNNLVRTVPEQGVGLAEVRIGDLPVPTTPKGEVWIHYTKPVANRYIPAWKVLAGEVSAQALANHILLVGASAQGLLDLRFSPMGGAMPGVEVHAQLLEQLLTGGGLARPAWAAAIEFLIILGGGLIVGTVALLTEAIVSFSLCAALLALLWAGAWQAFTTHGLLLDAAGPSVALSLIYVSASIVRHQLSEQRQRWIRQAFARYVSPNRVNYLIQHPDALELGGRRQQCSFVFTDLTNFTPLIEGMDPGAAVTLLNHYLDRMIAIAFSHQGTLDRIVGDAVAIMFSAPTPQPDHQRRALACALEMHRFAKQYADELQARGIAFGQTRIGIHSGEVIVGNFGGGAIFDYRALGDPVNVAARLEGANKHLGTLICVSEATLAGCPNWPARPIGRILLKGKSQPLMVLEPLDPQQGNDPDATYQAAFAQMRAEQPEALNTFTNLADQRPDDPLVALHLARLRAGITGDLLLMIEK